mgnify:FL=1
MENRKAIERILSTGLFAAKFLAKFTSTDLDDKAVGFVEANQTFIVDMIVKVMEMFDNKDQLTEDDMKIVMNMLQPVA